MPRTVSGRAVPDFNSSCEFPTSSTNVTFQNYTLNFATGTCSISGCNATKHSTIQERDICSTGNCEWYFSRPLDKKLLELRELTGNVRTGALTCLDTTTDPIVPADCVPVIQYLESLGCKPPILIFAYATC